MQCLQSNFYVEPNMLTSFVFSQTVMRQSSKEIFVDLLNIFSLLYCGNTYVLLRLLKMTYLWYVIYILKYQKLHKNEICWVISDHTDLVPHIYFVFDSFLLICLEWNSNQSEIHHSNQIFYDDTHR